MLATVQRVSDPLVRRMRGFGTTIFAEMSALALSTGTVNLGQGFPDTDGPAAMLEAHARGLRSGLNQYPPGPGVPALREAVARHQQRLYGIDLDPDAQVLVTVGATEAIAASVLALVEPGDEVLVVEPYYDSYAASVALAGAVRAPSRCVARRPLPLDADDLRPPSPPRTRLLLLNTPHNPTGGPRRRRAARHRRGLRRARPARHHATRSTST